MSGSIPPGSVAEALRIREGETLTERRVALYQGSTCLADAVNWFVPARLPPEIVARLETSDVPFGRLLAPWGVRRLHLDASVAADATCLKHRAVVSVDNGTRVAVVEETFWPMLLDYAFPA